MSANDYWAKAQSGSPGTNLAEMQARLYAGETTQRAPQLLLEPIKICCHLPSAVCSM